MSDGADYFQRLAWRIASALPHAGGGSLLVTSARRGEGRSYVAAALASALREQTAMPVALCDCGPSRNSHPSLEHVSPAPARNLLPLQHSDVTALQPADGGALVHVPFGYGDLSTLFHGVNVQRAVDTLRARFGYVVLDGPPLADCGALGACTDGTLLVVNARRTRREIVQESLKTNPGLRLKLLGVVLNEAPRYIPQWLYRRTL